MYCSSKMFAFFTIVVSLLYPVAGMKCFKCFNEQECETPDFVECNVELVKQTAQMFSFLPRSQTQTESTSFNCAAYNAVLANSTAIQLSGCFYSTYNPCEDIHAIPAQKWTCKYCDTKDGCNPASKLLENVLLIGIVSIFVIYLQKLY